MYSENLELLKEYVLLVESPTSEQMISVNVKKSIINNAFIEFLKDRIKDSKTEQEKQLAKTQLHSIIHIKNNIGVENLKHLKDIFNQFIPDWIALDMDNDTFRTYISEVLQRMNEPQNDDNDILQKLQQYNISNDDIVLIINLLTEYYTKLNKIS